MTAGLKWLTVPVATGASEMPIDQVIIGKTDKPWEQLHRRLLTEALGKAPYFADAISLWEEGISDQGVYLSRLNEKLLRNICVYLQITTPIVRSRDYGVPGEKTARLVNLLQKVGGTTYVSGPVAKDYLQLELFRDNGISLEYKAYDYPPYPQQFGEFVGTVTVLDLIANCGAESRRYLKSLSPNEVAVR